MSSDQHVFSTNGCPSYELKEGGKKTQWHIILDILNENGGSMTRGDLIQALSGVIHGKQSAEKIVNFYQNRLPKKGFLTVTKAEKKEKPKKSRKKETAAA